MSWNFTVHNINRAFEQMGYWYRDFMQRTEQSFRSLHQRLLFLEEREAWKGPSDEQLERVLRKILSEKFTPGEAPQQKLYQNPHGLKKGEHWVRPNDDECIPAAIPIDLAALQVDVKAVPSEEYQQTLQMLESEIVDYPNIDLSKNAQRDSAHEMKDES